jgi:flagellar motor protein MotB
VFSTDALVWRHLYIRDWGHHQHQHYHHHHHQQQWREAYAERWVAMLAQCKTAQASSAAGALVVAKGPTKHYVRARRGRAGAPGGAGPTLIVRRRQNREECYENDNASLLKAKRPDPDADGQRRAKRRRRQQQRAEEELLQEAEWREAMLRAYFAAIDRESLTEAEVSGQ